MAVLADAEQNEIEGEEGSEFLFVLGDRPAQWMDLGAGELGQEFRFGEAEIALRIGKRHAAFVGPEDVPVRGGDRRSQAVGEKLDDRAAGNGQREAAARGEGRGGGGNDARGEDVRERGFVGQDLDFRLHAEHSIAQETPIRHFRVALRAVLGRGRPPRFLPLRRNIV